MLATLWNYFCAGTVDSVSAVHSDGILIKVTLQQKKSLQFAPPQHPKIFQSAIVNIYFVPVNCSHLAIFKVPNKHVVMRLAVIIEAAVTFQTVLFFTLAFYHIKWPSDQPTDILNVGRR